MVLGLILVSLAVYFRSPVRPRNVVLISVDTLHAGHLSCYGYRGIETPNIDRLALEGVVFDNAATSVPLTLPAHASIFTGRNPLRHGVVDNYTSTLREEEETLAEVLEADGYATGGFVGAYVLDSSWGTAQGFDVYFDDFDTRGPELQSVEANTRSGDEVLERALPWLRRQDEDPFFLFIHFFDPHMPYDPPEPYRTNCDKDLVSCYDGEIAFVDSLVGKLVSELESLGVLDESLLILLGDHGESLGDHGESTHGFFLYDSTVRVPLIVKGPGIPASERVQAQVRTVDILPTVLDLLGLASRSNLDGVSLRPLLFDPEEDPELLAYIESRYPQLHFGWAPLGGLRSSSYKFVDAPRRELYDLSVDPGETRNLAEERPDVAEELASKLEMIRGDVTPTKREPHLPDPETVERLRALGYVTSTAATPNATSLEDLDDPKDKIDLFNRLADARVARQRDDTETALELLLSVVEEDPNVMLAHLTLGNVYLDTGDYKKAVTSFQTVLDGNDENVEALLGLGQAHQRAGEYREAAEALERCLEIDPRGSDAVRSLVEVRLAMGEGRQAESLIRDLGAEEQDESVKLLLASSLLSQRKRREAVDILGQIERQGSDDEKVLLSLGESFSRSRRR